MSSAPPSRAEEETREPGQPHVHTWIGDDCPEGWRRVGSIDVADPADIVTARDKGRRIGTIYDGGSYSVAEPCCADTYARTELGERADELEWKVEDLKHEVAFQEARASTAEAEVEELRAYAKEVGAALVGLTCNGSEFYRRAGDDFRVDPAACVEYVQDQRKARWGTIKSFAQRAHTAEARIVELERERDAAIKVCDMNAMSGGFSARWAENATKRAEAAEAGIAVLEAENARLRIAFHDATRRPLGVTPDSGAEFYDQRMADEAEERRPKGMPFGGQSL